MAIAGEAVEQDATVHWTKNPTFDWQKSLESLHWIPPRILEECKANFAWFAANVKVSTGKGNVQPPGFSNFGAPESSTNRHDMNIGADVPHPPNIPTQLVKKSPPLLKVEVKFEDDVVYTDNRSGSPQPLLGLGSMDAPILLSGSESSDGENDELLSSNMEQEENTVNIEHPTLRTKSKSEPLPGAVNQRSATNTRDERNKARLTRSVTMSKTKNRIFDPELHKRNDPKVSYHIAYDY